MPEQFPGVQDTSTRRHRERQEAAKGETAGPGRSYRRAVRPQVSFQAVLSVDGTKRSQSELNLLKTPRERR